MACTNCLQHLSSRFAAFSQAAAKGFSARLRRLGITDTHDQWAARAELCARCPMYRVFGKTAYCGSPFLRKPLREPDLDGCGCPITDKAKDPAEHCPLTVHHRAAAQNGTRCNCKWCVSTPALATAC